MLLSLLGDPTFVVAVAFVIFLILATRPVTRVLVGILDKRADHIARELSDALHLKEEAQELYAQAQQRHREILEQTSYLLEEAAKEAVLLSERAAQQLQDDVQQRCAAMAAKIAHLEATIYNDVFEDALAQAMASVLERLARNITPESSYRLIEASVARLPSTMH